MYYTTTPSAKGYDGKQQTFITKYLWDEANELISQQLKDGYVLIEMCFSTGKKQYFLVITPTGASDVRASDGAPPHKHWTSSG